jgi:hypothetical protein
LAFFQALQLTGSFFDNVFPPRSDSDSITTLYEGFGDPKADSGGSTGNDCNWGFCGCHRFVTISKWMVEK